MSSSENPDLNPFPPDGKCYSDDYYFNHGYDYDETSPLIDTSYLIQGYYDYESSSSIVTMSDKPMSSNANPNPNCSDSAVSRITEITETTFHSFPRELLKLNTEWLKSCDSELFPGYGNLVDAEKGKYIIKKFLEANMEYSCGGSGGVLPKDVGQLENGYKFQGPIILQVNEIVNIGSTPEDWFQDAPTKRWRKLSMTDGVQRVYGLEDRPIEDLKFLVPAGPGGVKVVIDHVTVRNGHLMLIPEGFKVLGGMVKDLEVERRKDLEAERESKKEKKANGTQTWLYQSRARDTHADRKPNDADSCVNGVGNFSISDNSTSQDAIHSESSIQDLAVKKKDFSKFTGGPIQEEAIQDSKEVEEGAVLKKRNPELAEKQSDGQPAAMAGVSEAEISNMAFPADTSDEIMYQKFVVAAEKASPADPTCGELKEKLQKIWHEVGEWYGKWMLLEIEQECVSVFKKNLDQDLLQQLQKISYQCNNKWRDIYRKCLDVYKMKIKQAEESRKHLLEELDFAVDQHSKITSALDPEKEYAVPEKSNGTIRKQLADMLVKLQPLLELKKERKEMLADVQSQIQKIRGVAGTPIVDENDLSLEKLNRLRSELKELQTKAEIEIQQLTERVKELESHLVPSSCICRESSDKFC